MKKLIWTVAGGAIMMLLVIPLLDLFYIYPEFRKLSQENAIDDARNISLHLERLSREIIQNDGALQEHEREISNLSSQFKIKKIKVFKGREVIYSTEREDLVPEKRFNKNAYYQDVVEKGQEYWKVVNKGASSLEKQKYSVSVLEFYRPFMNGDVFVGSVEVYLDISLFNQRMDVSTKHARISILLAIITVSILIVSAAIIMARVVEKKEESERWYDVIQKNMEDALCIIDPETFSIIGCNRKFEDEFGSLESILGMKCHKITHGEEQPCSDGGCPLIKTIKTGLYSEEYHVHHKQNGDLIHVKVSTSPIRDENGKMVAVVHFAHDVTNLKLREEALQKVNQELEEILVDKERSNRDMISLIEMSNVFGGCSTLDEVYDVIAQHVEKIFPRMSGQLLICHDESGLIQLVTSWGVSNFPYREFPANECYSLQTGEIKVVGDGDRSGIYCKSSCSITCGHVCIPLIAHRKVLGIISLQIRHDADKRDCFLDRTEFAAVMAGEIASTLLTFNLNQQLWDKSVRDPLTGLHNRRYLEESIDREMNRVRRERTSLSVAMIDIDHFKDVNDAFGHDAGDKVLSHLAGMLIKFFRGSDLICRYGGEEFIAVLSGAKLEHAVQRAECFRKIVEGSPLIYGEREIDLTISIGVATLKPGQDFLAVSKSADEALYQAKKYGRNRVESSQI